MRSSSRKLIVAAAVSALALGACSSGGSKTVQSSAETGGSEGESGATTVAEGVKMTAVLSGSLGDKSFMDSANEGFEKATSELGVDIKVLQGVETDAPAWERNLTEASAMGDSALIIAGSTQIASTVEKVAAQFPDQKYLIFDSESVGPNVAGISYSQNEGGFLAGTLAALVTSNPDVFPNATGSMKVGIVGGKDIPVIQDFIVGYKQGVAEVDPSIEVDVRFAENFGNPQKGYDIATAMYKDGVDVIYQVAGGTGVGVLQASADSGRYGIGTDSNQNDLQPEYIVGSILKNVGATVFDAIDSFLADDLPMGETLKGTLANDGIGIAINENLVPTEIVDQLNAARQKVVDGQVTVDSAL